MLLKDLLDKGYTVDQINFITGEEYTVTTEGELVLECQDLNLYRRPTHVIDNPIPPVEELFG